MNPSKFAILAVAMACATVNAAAQVSGDSREVLDSVTLDKVIVEGDRVELALRLIKIGLQNHRSSSLEDANKVYCRLGTRPGTHFKYLYCGKNWAWDARRREHLSRIGAGGFMRTARPWQEEIFVTHSPANRAQLEDRLDALGPDFLNREIVAQAMKGVPLPDNVPDEDELDRFMQAYRAVHALSAKYDPKLAQRQGDERRAMLRESDAAMARAIAAAGLSVERYNEIVGFVERFESLKQYVARGLNGSPN